MNYSTALPLQNNAAVTIYSITLKTKRKVPNTKRVGEGISASDPVPFFCFMGAAGGWEGCGRAGRWGRGGSSLKNGVFLTAPEGRDCAKAAETPPQRPLCAVAVAWLLWSSAFVRQAAKGGKIPAFRRSKKHHRFF